ncbi:carbohydrate-binding protein [Intestinimonas sp.]|uniref:carbohydrate-binding protein n=1 Tax=Intestinimonas sp. TaxID=1965293 RepID=UPI00260DC887|nr:carbohydrate-binding protein [Intestinimonas sp.]
MRAEQIARGVILYEKDRYDLEQEAALLLSRRQAAALGDEEAAQVGALFPEWKAGTAYTAGERISDERGNLYRVVQNHTSQADWPMEKTPALYTPLGVTTEEPDAIPEWRQPAGAHDAYHKGDRVKYHGKIYESTMDGNVWEPGVTGWIEVEL